MVDFETQEWTNRISETPNRRRLTLIDETTGQEDNTNSKVYAVEREEGQITSVGTQFSAENMNGLETRIKTAFDDLKPVVLYSNDSGSVNTITLSDSASNYQFIDLYYGWTGDPQYASSRIYMPNNKKLSLCEIASHNNNLLHTLYIRASQCFISDNTISFIQDWNADINVDKENAYNLWHVTKFEANLTNYIKQVIGYK